MHDTDDETEEVDPATCPHPETADYGSGWECKRCGASGQPMFGSAEVDPRWAEEQKKLQTTDALADLLAAYMEYGFYWTLGRREAKDHLDEIVERAKGALYAERRFDPASGLPVTSASYRPIPPLPGATAAPQA